MYDDGNLLQANVTLIAGVLIFLTFTPLSRGMREILERRSILFNIWVVMTLFLISIILLSFLPTPTTQERDWLTFYTPRAFFIAGVISISITALTKKVYSQSTHYYHIDFILTVPIYDYDKKTLAQNIHH